VVGERRGCGLRRTGDTVCRGRSAPLTGDTGPARTASPGPAAAAAARAAASAAASAERRRALSSAASADRRLPSAPSAAGCRAAAAAAGAGAGPIGGVAGGVGVGTRGCDPADLGTMCGDAFGAAADGSAEGTPRPAMVGAGPSARSVSASRAESAQQSAPLTDRGRLRGGRSTGNRA
jgi:hypothetical protein